LLRNDFFVGQALEMNDLVRKLSLTDVGFVAELGRAVREKFLATDLIGSGRLIGCLASRNDDRVLIA
jgi:hypothetical protein